MYNCSWLQATYAVNDALTHRVLSQEPLLELEPEASLVELPDFIVSSAFVDVLFGLCCVLWAVTLAAVEKHWAHRPGTRPFRGEAHVSFRLSPLRQPKLQARGH